MILVLEAYLDLSSLNYPGMIVHVAVLVASEAMVASKWPWRSNLTSDFNSVASITNVLMLLWPVKTSLRWFTQTTGQLWPMDECCTLVKRNPQHPRNIASDPPRLRWETERVDRLMTLPHLYLLSREGSKPAVPAGNRKCAHLSLDWSRNFIGKVERDFRRTVDLSKARRSNQPRR